ncbi:MAG: Hpt domain-containing protein [Lachnospiraceae bacterium]|nr:Hpt domain-containing protein [Lachnospiraceae bacterium]
MSQDFSDLREKGLDVDAALSYTGDSRKYILALTRFHDAYDKNRSKIEKCLKEKDYDNYCMLVHALKSNARMIGCNNLGNVAERLQYASADKDVATVEEYNDSMLSQYEEVKNIVSEYAKSGSEIDSAEKDKVAKLVEELKESLEDYDYKKSMDVYSELLKCNFKPNKKIILNDIKSNIDEFMYDEAFEIANQLL